MLIAQKNDEGNCVKIRKAFIANTTLKIWLWEILNDSDGTKGSWGVQQIKENGHNLKALQELWYARLKEISHLSHYKQPQSWENMSTWIISYIPIYTDTLGSPRSQIHSFWQTWYLSIFINLIHCPVVCLFGFLIYARLNVCPTRLLTLETVRSDICFFSLQHLVVPTQPISGQWDMKEGLLRNLWENF